VFQVLLYIMTSPGLRISDSLSEEYDANMFYPLSDAPDHEFIVRELSRNSLRVEIRKAVNGKRQKKPVQSAIVRHCSVAAGHGLDGEPIIEPYVLDLRPDKEIFPIETLIGQLMAMGIENWRITPMFDRTLHNCVARHSGPHMQSNARVSCVDIPPRGGFTSSRLYKVKDARWAILTFEGSLSHIYLWPEAAEVAEEVVETVRSVIQAAAASA